MKINEQNIEREKKKLLKRFLGKESSKRVKSLILLSLIDNETEDSLARKLLSLA
jgi:hypothetical protein